MKNAVTGKTCACVSSRRWTTSWRKSRSGRLTSSCTASARGTQMKATGEAMAIGQSVEEALMKAVRGAEIGCDTCG